MCSIQPKMMVPTHRGHRSGRFSYWSQHICSTAFYEGVVCIVVLAGKVQFLQRLMCSKEIWHDSQAKWSRFGISFQQELEITNAVWGRKGDYGWGGLENMCLQEIFNAIFWIYVLPPLFLSPSPYLLFLSFLSLLKSSACVCVFGSD